MASSWPRARSHLFYMGDDEAHPPEFKNFDFKAEVMTTPGSNSGIYFHTRYQEGGWPAIGFEVQVNNSHGDPVKTASIYHIVKNFVPPAKDNEWFTEEIIVRGRNIVTKVNGKVICDYTEPEGVKGPMEKIDKGTFALQAHDPKSKTSTATFGSNRCRNSRAACSHPPRRLAATGRWNLARRRFYWDRFLGLGRWGAELPAGARICRS